MARAQDLADRLVELTATYGVPGAQVGVLADGEIVDAAVGVLSRGTGVTATTDSVFQIGSTTKAWTATLVGQLVDEGLVELDAPVRRYLPEFRVRNENAAAAITVRRLLNHSSGIEGDVFVDTGRGDDAVEKFVSEIAGISQVHMPGEMFSYCNTGYVLLGRIVEVLRGKPFDAVLRERIAMPLGLAHLATNADEAILHRAAVGHLEPRPGAGFVPAPIWALPASNAPAGARLAMPVSDLLGFARMHLDAGLASDGTRVLSEAGVLAMTRPEVEVPDLGYCSHWGLGWQLFDHAGAALFGHDGKTLGQAAFLRVAPDAGVAIALLTNGGDAAALYQELLGDLLDEYAGIRLPAPAVPPANPEPADAVLVGGCYRSGMLEYTVDVDDDGRTWLQARPLTPEAAALMTEFDTERKELVRLRDDALISANPHQGRHIVFALLGGGYGHGARYLHNTRAMPRHDE